MSLPSDFTLLQVIPELETGGAEQSTIDVARAVIDAGGRALVATRGGRMAARLEADGGRLAQMPVQTKNPLVMLGNASRLVDLIRRERVSVVHARSRAPAFSALWAAHWAPRRTCSQKSKPMALGTTASRTGAFSPCPPPPP